MSLKPIKNNVVVELHEAVSRTKSGIYVPPSAHERSAGLRRATVVAVFEPFQIGNGQMLHPQVKVGDVVVLSKEANLLSTEDVGYNSYLLNENEILAIDSEKVED
jgi:co-chaperonin GroES (HSP10)